MFPQIFESFDISPYGYLRNRSIQILCHVDYNSQLRIEQYDALSRPMWCIYLRLLGKYKFIKGNVELPYDVMDGIYRMQFHSIPNYCSHNDFISITASETPCMHPCVNVNIDILYSHEQILSCAICRYFGFDSSQNDFCSKHGCYIRTFARWLTSNRVGFNRSWPYKRAHYFFYPFAIWSSFSKQKND